MFAVHQTYYEKTYWRQNLKPTKQRILRKFDVFIKSLGGKDSLTNKQWNALCEFAQEYDALVEEFWNALDNAQTHITDKQFFNKLERIKALKGGIMIWKCEQ